MLSTTKTLQAIATNTEANKENVYATSINGNAASLSTTPMLSKDDLLDELELIAYELQILRDDMLSYATIVTLQDHADFSLTAASLQQLLQEKMLFSRLSETFRNYLQTEVKRDAAYFRVYNALVAKTYIEMKNLTQHITPEMYSNYRTLLENSLLEWQQAYAANPADPALAELKEKIGKARNEYATALYLKNVESLVIFTAANQNYVEKLLAATTYAEIESAEQTYWESEYDITTVTQQGNMTDLPIFLLRLRATLSSNEQLSAEFNRLQHCFLSMYNKSQEKLARLEQRKNTLELEHKRLSADEHKSPETPRGQGVPLHELNVSPVKSFNSTAYNPNRLLNKYRPVDLQNKKDLQNKNKKQRQQNADTTFSCRN